MRSLAALLTLLSTLPLGAATGPSEAAVKYLQQIASGEAGRDLTKSTALSKEVTSGRLEEIRGQISRLKEALQGCDFSTLQEREDGDLAAVLVAQDAGPDVLGKDIRPIGLIRVGDEWRPAPLPGSFDNAGLSFDAKALARARALEDWMMATRSQTLVGMREDAQRIWQEKVRGAVPADLLRDGKPDKLVSALVDAFVKGNQHAVYALLGGTDDPPRPDWDNLSKIVRRILNDKRSSSEAWGLITRPQVMRAVVESQPGAHQATVSLVCQDPGPERPQRPRALHFTVVKADSGQWHVELPQLLLTAVKNREQSAQMAKEAQEADASDIKRFPAKLRETYPAAPQKTARAATDALIAVLMEPSLENAIPLLDLSGRDQASQTVLTRAGSLWAGLHASGDRRALIPLDFIEEDDEACGIYQFFSSADAGEAQLVRIYLRKDDGGWLADPLTRLDKGMGSESFVPKVSAAMDKLSANWLEGRFARIQAPLPAEGPQEQPARELVTHWHAARLNGDVGAMLGMVVAVDDETGLPSIPKNLGYEIAERAPAEIGAVYREGAWTCVAVKINGDEPSYGLYPVVDTPQGPRVLLELYLRGADSRSANYLNSRTLARAAEAFPDAGREKLEACIQKYRQTLAPATPPEDAPKADH